MFVRLPMGYVGTKDMKAHLQVTTHVLREKLNEGPGLLMHQHPLRGDLERRRDGKIPWFPGHCPRLPFTIQDSAHTKVMSQA